MTRKYFWCGRQFGQRRGSGSQQRYCSQRCRHNYGTAARRWVAAALRQEQKVASDRRAAMTGPVGRRQTGGNR